jgi:predicted small metal-binding protein
MRALDCQCGKHLEAADDDELYGQVREHVDRDHPEMELSDEQVRGLVAGGAYDK